MSYSQQQEDVVICAELDAIFGESYKGKLLDIGAWHATQLSNSRMLIERDWRAVLIEPSPGPCAGLVEAYGGNERIDVISAAVSVEPGQQMVRMFITRDAVSTSVESVHEAWKAQGGYVGSLWAPAITLEQIWNQFGGFDFVNIDAEGMSVDIARAYFASGQQPAVVCVEHDCRIPELMQFAQAAGYRALHINDTNVILRRK